MPTAFELYRVTGKAGNVGMPGSPILHFDLLVNSSAGTISGQAQHQPSRCAAERRDPHPQRHRDGARARFRWPSHPGGGAPGNVLSIVTASGDLDDRGAFRGSFLSRSGVGRARVLRLQQRRPGRQRRTGYEFKVALTVSSSTPQSTQSGKLPWRANSVACPRGSPLRLPVPGGTIACPSGQIRAGIATTPEESVYTSGRDRIRGMGEVLTRLTTNGEHSSRADLRSPRPLAL